MPCGVRSNTKQLVILSAKRERIRISPLKGKRIAAGLKPLAMTRRGGETDCRTPYGGLACRLGRCFCFAEVSTGHPHRNDEVGENGCAKAFVIYNSAVRITNSALFYNNGFKKTNSREKFAAVFESCGYSFVSSEDS